MLTSDPLFEETLRALDAFDEPLAVDGAVAAGDVRIVLPSGERSPELGPHLVSWLLKRAEEAPFGDGDRTRIDPEVRHAYRLIDRGEARIEGIDLAPILERIEGVLSPDEHLRAELTDVLIYPMAGHFQRHRDTPQAGTMVGTLVVCLPLAHRGGELRLTSGSRRATFLAAPEGKGELPYAAFHGDVDHEVTPVREGHRVTLTYCLHRDGRPRPSDPAPRVALRAAVAALLASPTFLPEGGKLLLPCARRALAAVNAVNLSVEHLVGRDREIAAVIASLDLPVRVRRCLAFVPVEGRASSMTGPLRFADTAIRLARPLPASIGEAVTLAPRAYDEEGDDDSRAHSLHSLEAHDTPRSVCLVRAAAHATLVHEATFSPTGYFGNEHFDAWLYVFAAVEATVPDLLGRGLVIQPVLPRVRHRKFGEGDLLGESPGNGDVILEVKFDDGTVRKLLGKFVERC